MNGDRQSNENQRAEQQAHILIVDDDQQLCELLVQYLRQQGYNASVANHAQRAQQLLQSFDFDVLILDNMMPDMTGVEFLDQQRSLQNDVPVLMLSALDQSQDRIQGLKTGADDYMGKPFEPEELLMRIQALLRRRNSGIKSVPDTPTFVRFGDFTLHLESGDLRKQGERVHLIPSEVGLLKTLALNAGKVLSREALAERQNCDPLSRSVDVQITRLRRKIEPDPKFPTYIKTVRNQGYIFHLS